VSESDQAIAIAVRVLGQIVHEIWLTRDIETACPTHLTRNQFMILNLLTARPGFVVGEIAHVLRVTPPAVCRAVDQLEALELVERRTRVRDRRTHEVMLRPAGHSIVARFCDVSSARFEEALDGFNADEKQTLLKLLRRLVHNSVENESDTDIICLQCFDRSGRHCVLPESDDRCLRRREKQPGSTA